MKRQAIVLAGIHLFAGFLFLSPSYIRPDSVAVHSWLRSLVVDGDFLFFDEWAGFRMLGDGFAYFKEVTDIGTLANHWWVGSSILVAPFYLASHGVSRILPGALFPDDGFFGLDLASLSWTSVLFHALTLAIAILAVRRLRGDAPPENSVRVDALLCASLGTPAFWYAFRMPVGTHAAGMLGVALATLLCIRAVCSREGDSAEPNASFLTGLVAGLAIATRIQHVVLLPALLYAMNRGRKTRRDYLVAALGASLPILVQGAAWFAIYGTPLGPITAGANLEGVTWMPFRRLAFLPVLVSPWRGLFVWSPIWIPALVGLVLLARDKDSVVRRHTGVICLLMFFGELLANATLDRYWWGGMSFGPRRFVDLTILVAIGLSEFLSRTRLAGRIVAGLATGWSCVLMLGATARTIDLSRYLSWTDLLHGARASTESLSLEVLNSPVTSGALALQSVIALLLIAGVGAAVIWMISRRPKAAFRLGPAWVLICLAAALFAIVPTRSRAESEAKRFGMTTEAARSTGPLIDQKGLLTDELSWLEATGRMDEADSTRSEIERIDEELARLGH